MDGPVLLLFLFWPADGWGKSKSKSKSRGTRGYERVREGTRGYEGADMGRIQDTIQKRNAKWHVHVTRKRVYILAHSPMLADEKKGGPLDWENKITRNGRMAAVTLLVVAGAASPKHNSGAWLTKVPR
jgi:hypothetical protein